MEILREFIWQFITVVFMGGVIVLAVFLGHKLRNFMDKRKQKKEGQ
ncbi:MAG: hypothetical protein IK088_02305 [Lachnospiraceae bacterium]|nr:hypothetical protein [Lachnospiraceae bacterium]